MARIIVAVAPDAVGLAALAARPGIAAAAVTHNQESVTDTDVVPVRSRPHHVRQ
jgi:hypothetical protein